MMQILKSGYEPLTSEKAYILGVLCGDGYMEIKRRRVRLSNVKDEDFIDFFGECIIKQYGVRICKYKRKNNYFELFVGSCLVYEDLMRYDQTKKGFKTKTWEVPNEIIESNEEIKKYFVRGFCDSEMAVNPPYVRIFICSSNLGGLKQIKELLSEFGINSKIRNRYSDIYDIIITSTYFLNKFVKEIGISINFKREQINKILNKVKNYSLRDGTYEKAMKLRSEGFGHKRIAKLLNIKEGVVRGWIFEGHNPYSPRGRKSIIINKYI